MMGRRRFTWTRNPERGSDLNALADAIQNEFRHVNDITREKFANAPAVRAVRNLGARKIWMAGSQFKEITYSHYVRGQPRVYRDQERATSWKSDQTTSEYDLSWSFELGARGLPNDPAPTELLETKVKLRQSTGDTWTHRFDSLLGDAVVMAIDVVADPNINRGYLYAVYETDGGENARWDKIVPENGSYTMQIRPHGASDEPAPRGAPWINQGNGVILADNMSVFRQIFGRGGAHHLVGFFRRNGDLDLTYNVVSRNCGIWSFALYSLERIQFVSEDWEFNRWLP